MWLNHIHYAFPYLPFSIITHLLMSIPIREAPAIRYFGTNLVLIVTLFVSLFLLYYVYSYSLSKHIDDMIIHTNHVRDFWHQLLYFINMQHYMTFIVCPFNFVISG